jgi:branched-chain amino acid transport system ATP-binding protein
MADRILELSGVDIRYGLFQAVFGIDLAVDRGEAVAIIGANGAGKSTLLNAIAGLVPVHAGSITYQGRRLDDVPAHKRVGMGIALVPEGRRIFASLTVEENLLIGGHSGRPGPWTVERVLETFPLLQRLMKRQTTGLSGGERQALAIGRGLMSNPDLILLDEVSLGLAPIVVKQVYEAIPAIREQGTTVLVVEQDVNQALAVRFSCMLEGRVSLSGDTTNVDHARITEAYFGLTSAHGAGASAGGEGGA